MSKLSRYLNLHLLLGTIFLIVWLTTVSILLYLIHIGKTKGTEEEWQDVRITCYQAIPAQCDSDPFVTASGKRICRDDPSMHKYAAISRDLLGYYNFGDTIEVKGTFRYDGYWIVADVMNKRHSRSIDLLISNCNRPGLWHAKIRRF